MGFGYIYMENNKGYRKNCAHRLSCSGRFPYFFMSLKDANDSDEDEYDDDDEDARGVPSRDTAGPHEGSEAAPEDADAQPPWEEDAGGVGDLASLMAEFQSQGPQNEPSADPVILVEDSLVEVAVAGATAEPATGQTAEPAMGQTTEPATGATETPKAETREEIVVVVPDSPSGTANGTRAAPPTASATSAAGLAPEF